MTRQVALYGAAGGVLIALLKVIEYKHFVLEYPSEIYGGLVALIFTALGIYFGLRWTRAKQVVVIREVPVRMDGPFVLNAVTLKEVGLTAREHEILGLRPHLRRHLLRHDVSHPAASEQRHHQQPQR